MRIAVIGAGYVGSVTGTCFAELGHEVICSDLDEKRIDSLNHGVLPFFEPYLEPMLKANLEEGRLKFVADNCEAIKNAEVILICVGTPPLPNGKPDLRSLERAIEDIAITISGYALIVEKSSLPIQTGEWLEQQLKKSVHAGVDYDVAAVPQFMREGYAVHDFLNADRIVIGASNQRAIDKLVSLYRPFNAPLLITDINSAELIKHASNAFLAMKISFINSIAQICEKTGADVTQVAKGLGLDHRILPTYLQAGIGYGGIFFPKDIASLVSISEQFHINLDLIKSVETVNRYQRLLFVEKIEEALGGSVKGKTIAMWGLAYRPNTSDLRDAPSIHIIRSLEKRGAKVQAYDPIANNACKALLPKIGYFDDPYEVTQNADAIVVVTEWSEFLRVNFNRLKEMTACRIIIDGRNLYPANKLAELGFTYHSVGRKTANPTTSKEKAVAIAK